MRIEIHPDDRNGVLYQWDIGQRLRLIGVEAGCRVDFIGGSGEPLCVDAYADGDGVFADVPNILLQYAGWVKVLVYVTDAATGETVSEKTLPVLARKKPSEYVYSETEIKTWEDLRKQISSLEKPTAADVSTVFALGNETADSVQRALDLLRIYRGKGILFSPEASVPEEEGTIGYVDGIVSYPDDKAVDGDIVIGRNGYIGVVDTSIRTDGIAYVSTGYCVFGPDDIMQRPTAAEVSATFALGDESADNVQRALDLIAAAQEDGSQVSLLVETDMLPAVHDADGAILTDESGNVILRY